MTVSVSVFKLMLITACHSAFADTCSLDMELLCQPVDKGPGLHVFNAPLIACFLSFKYMSSAREVEELFPVCECVCVSMFIVYKGKKAIPRCW